MLKINTFTEKRPIFKQNRAKNPKKCSNLFPKNFPKATKKGKTRRFYPNFGAPRHFKSEPDGVQLSSERNTVFVPSL